MTRVVLAALCLVFTARGAAAQSQAACKDFFEDKHQALDCVEGIFSETPVHLTMSSLPPGNGLPLGILYDNAVHDVDQDNYKSLHETKLALVGSTNGSWYATGSLTWLPPLHYRIVNRVINADTGLSRSCHQLGPLCTSDVFGLDVYGVYRGLNSQSRFDAAGAPSSFKEREAFGGITLRMPLTDWLRVDGQFEDRKPSLPGELPQPDFFHSSMMFRTNATAITERATNPLAPGLDQSTVPLMKPRVKYVFQNSAGYHWYNDLDTGGFSFQQFVFEGDESIEFAGVIQKKLVPAGTSWVVDHLCDGPRATQMCQFGRLSFKSLVQLSSTGSGRVVPFYFQPTLGGADIESRTSLRGFDNYRFRDNNTAVMQIEFTRTFKTLDPLGIFFFYDAGLVGPTAPDMWSSPLRQDGGPGLTIRLQGNVIMQVFAAVGAGHGVKVGYNFERLF